MSDVRDLAHQAGHAPGYTWRNHTPTLDPWATLADAPTGCVVGGLCEAGYHQNCNQLAWQPDHTPTDCPDDHPRRCVCPCHTDPAARDTLF